jgi:hypothetical protein
MPKSPKAAIMLQQYSLVHLPQARFLLQIREHAITRLLACNPVKRADAAHCPGYCQLLGLNQVRASMHGQGFTRPPQLLHHVAIIVDQTRRRAPMDM